MATRRKSSSQAGLTLIELMIVVAIIGVLSSLAIPAYTSYVTRARLSNAVTSIQPLKSAVAACGQEYGNDFSRCTSGVPTIPGFTPTKEVAAASVGTGGVISLTFSNQVAEGVNGKIITFAPSNPDASNVVWNVEASSITSNPVAIAFLTRNNI